MAFLDFLNRQNILGKLDQVRQGVARNLPYITGVGAGLIAAPVGLAPLGGFAGYGAGRVLQGALAPESVSQTPSIGMEKNLGDPYATLARAGAVGLGFGAVQPLLNKLPARVPAPQPITQTPAQQATLQAHKDQALLKASQQMAAQEATSVRSALQGLELKQQQIEKLLGTQQSKPWYQTETFGGWTPGLKAQFDNAVWADDAETVKRLLPQVPKDYLAKFADKIAKVLGTNPASLIQ